MPRLLFIEDNEDILINLFEWFEAKGFSCDCSRNGVSGLDMALTQNFDCLILDLMLPGLNGLDLCQHLREAGSNLPVIMLTARDSLEDRILGLNTGADDYLIKPFSLKELEARVRALLRRHSGISPVISFGPVELNTIEHNASREGITLRLSPGSFKILEMLMRNAPGIVRKEALEELLWGDNPPEGSALRNHIHELRKVLDKPFACSLLETVPHLGWRLKLPE